MRGRRNEAIDLPTHLELVAILEERPHRGNAIHAHGLLLVNCMKHDSPIISPNASEDLLLRRVDTVHMNVTGWISADRQSP